MKTFEKPLLIALVLPFAFLLTGCYGVKVSDADAQRRAAVNWIASNNFSEAQSRRGAVDRSKHIVSRAKDANRVYPPAGYPHNPVKPKPKSLHTDDFGADLINGLDIAKNHHAGSEYKPQQPTAAQKQRAAQIAAAQKANAEKAALQKHAAVKEAAQPMSHTPAK